jgi:hypothetical protein
MANQHSDSAMDNSQFWHSYAGSSKGQGCDHLDRLEEEWQVTTPSPCQSDCSALGIGEQSYQETQLSRLEDELESATEMLDDTGMSLGFFGISEREVHEWQYDSPVVADAKYKLVDDSQSEDLNIDLDRKVSPLRGELAQWLPPT